MRTMKANSDFGSGSIAGNIMNLAVPMTLAQLINVLYNIVDRIYIGHLPHTSTQALTGLGLTFPIITIITAFSNLFGVGGVPLFSISRGRNETKRAGQIMDHSFSLLIRSGLILMLLCYLIKKPVLYLFGASHSTFPYADAYLTIYLLGTVFVMVSLGMNGYINAQGFGTMGMLTVLLGAVTNLILDPLFIFVFHMGVRGAALATLISQFLSALWVFKFLTGKKAIIRLSAKRLRLNMSLVKEISLLGMSSFVMAVTNGLVQIVCNATLKRYGGDLYVGVMTVLNSVREIITMPVMGISNAAQPVIGFNYGAKKYDRVRSSILFLTAVCVSFTVFVWALLFFFPSYFIHIFNSEPSLIRAGVPAMQIYFFGIFMMSLQFSGQSTFTGLGRSKQAIFFSLLRKAFIVVPLTFWLPTVGSLGTKGVFLAEPISNFLGGTACFVTMLATVWRELRRKDRMETGSLE